MQVSIIDGYGGRFEFEPPIEVGDRKELTLQTLATLAIVGDSVPGFIYDMAEKQVGDLLNSGASNPRMVQVALSTLLRDKHKVTLI